MSLAIAYIAALAKILLALAGLLIAAGLLIVGFLFVGAAWDQMRDGEGLDRVGWMVVGALVGMGLLVGDLVFGRAVLWVLG